ncbi:uncharacterized protein CG7065-like isoform X2 [Anthonomus grandis grandis]|uniref:uncharacterized protein CG7065-like isoform X2 n=1 Tax=Anthonomus grandis grandis TaxID=2921223 RepID=UPI0021655CF0|nr:uncharacterized protein CG7065-like isoform X2 [Anthonomus grandis grandis]
MMEPAAPGTEDETIDLHFVTKQETEQERLLKLKVSKNGKPLQVFELSYTNGSESWFCKVCDCPVMGRVYQHEIGRRHTQNIAALSGDVPESTKKEITETKEEFSSPIEVAPGEPVPPGFEGELNRNCDIQERLDGFKVGPLVALEYLIEMYDFDPAKEPSYLCILCDKKGDPRTVLTHLASYNHISQYLQKHFPTCYRALAPYMTKQYKRNWQTVLQKVAEAIEKKYGRLKPFSLDHDKFEKDRLHYLEIISKGNHFSEQMGPTFVELIVHEELTKTFDDEGKVIKKQTAQFGGHSFIERPPVKEPPKAKRSPSPPVVAKPTKKARPQGPEPKKPFENRPPLKGNRGERKRSLSSVSSLSSEDESRGRGRRFARNKSPPRVGRDNARRFNDRRDERGTYRPISPKRRNNPMARPRDLEDERRRNREKEKQQKMDEYEKLSKAIENDVEKFMKQYEKNPEKHPKYNEEWKLFWNKRYKELQMEGKDASKYDFKPEWIGFWGKRMRELANEDLATRKEGLKRRLGLAEEIVPVKFRIGGGPVMPSSNLKSEPKNTRPTMPMAARPDNDPEVIIVEDRKDPPPRRPYQRERSHSPWESDVSPPRSRGHRSRSTDRRRPIKPKERSPSRRSMERDTRRPLLKDKRSPERRRTPDKGRRSVERSSRRSPEKRGRSPERTRRSPERSRRSRSRELRNDRPRRSSPLLKDKRSRSPDSYKSGSKSYPRESEFLRERDLVRELDIKLGGTGIIPTERNRDRARESSYERDVRARDRIRTVADLPWEREKLYGHGPPPMRMHDDYYAPRDPYRPVLNFVPPPGVQEPEPDDEEVNIVSVLRLLTALEEKLGSLGPKIIDLLAQALALEKKEANSSEILLDNEINCVMFETVKEKLKGQLLAGLVDPLQERAFKKAIQKTANLIHIASQRKKTTQEPPSAAVAVPGVGAVDKAAIAKQLASALVAQGKTDVTQAELEQLINAVVGMAEASKGSGKPMTAASFLSQLSGGGESSKEQKKFENPKEKVIIPRVKSKEEKLKDTINDLDLMTEPLSPGTPEKSSASHMENLSDSDLQTLLQNFKDLSTEEQMNLINYLKKMEFDEPERVERLRKFVNLGPEKPSKEPIIDVDSPRRNGRDDFDAHDKRKKTEKIHLDSEDEDYSYEDVVKAASKNIKQKEMETNRKLVEDSIVFSSAQKSTGNLSDAKSIISSLMGSFSSASASSNMLGLPSGPSSSMAALSSLTTTTSSADLTKALNGINMDNLASIVSSVQKVNQNKQLKFEPPQSSPKKELFSNPPKSNPPASKPAESTLHISPPVRTLQTDKDIFFEPPKKIPPLMNAPMRPMGGPVRPVGPPHLSMGPRGPGPRGPGMNMPPRGQFQQRPPFGGPNMRPRPPFMGNQRFGGPPRQGFNPRW